MFAMDLFGIFRNIFGVHSPPKTTKKDESEQEKPLSSFFRNPFWNNDEDEETDDELYNRGQRQPIIRSNDGFGSFGIFSNPLEMQRFFEQQMDLMIRRFQETDFPSLFGEFSREFQPLTENESTLPRKSLRDEFLKPSYETYEENAARHKPDIFGFSLKPDSDIDEEFSRNYLKDGNETLSQPHSLYPFGNEPFQFIFSGQSVSTQTIQKPDGSTETIKTTKDHDGNEETTIIKKNGSDVITKVTRRDKTGCITEFEEIKKDSGPPKITM